MCAIKTTEISKLFDFKDGYGPVPAHKHVLGGGWVADTAKVESSVYVGPCAHIFGHAEVSDHVKIGDYSEISGYAKIKDNVCISGKVRVQGNTLIEGSIILEKECFVGAGTHLKGDIRIGDHATFLQTTRCLECPLLKDTYGSTEENPCANCLNAMVKRNNETGAYKSRRRKRYPGFTGPNPLVSAFKAGNPR